MTSAIFRKEQALTAAREGRLPYAQLVRILDNASALGLNERERQEFDMARQIKAGEIPDPARIANAMAVVTTSGWGKEPETTLPGVIQPEMNL